MRIATAFSGALALFVVASSAGADVVFGFGAITANSVSDPGIGAAQLTVTISDAGFNAASGHNQVEFVFANSGPEASSITDVYFDDGTLLGIATIDNSVSGVSFSQGASPGHLPSGNNASPPFEATQGFLADSDAPAQPNGVNPGEFLGILFDLQGSLTFAETLADLASGALRIGIHVQGFADGNSESFVNGPPPPPTVTVPLPGAHLLGLMGLGVVGWVRKRIK